MLRCFISFAECEGGVLGQTVPVINSFKNVKKFFFNFVKLKLLNDIEKCKGGWC